MTRGKKKTEEPVKEEVKPSEKVSLIVFKAINGIDNMTYAGFKASLEAEDTTEYTQAELEKKFKEYKEKNAFIKK